MRKVSIAVVLVLVFTLAFNAGVLAQDNNDSKLKSNGSSSKKNTVSTVFFETDVRDALNEISMQTGVNIIYDETVQGTVTLDLKNTPLEKALEMICISGGFSYKKIEDYYVVGLPEPGSPTFQHLSTTETIELEYLTASEAQELLPPFYSDYIQSTGSKEKMITITAPDAVIKRFKKDLAKIDRAEKMVLVKMLVTEVSKEVLNETGSNFVQFFKGDASADLSYYDYLDETADEGDHFVGLNESLTLAAKTSYGQLLTELQVLEENQKAEIEANPKVRVSDGSTAELFVGQERSFVLQTGEDESTLETVEAGITLNVTPKIINGEELKLEVAPDISHLTQDGEDEMVVRRSELSTTVYAKNNETLTLAGMTLDEVVNYESQVPVLGDIPLVRWLFQSKTKEKGKRELLIFITPKIIEGQANEAS